jgi:pimeloyl-ACP methyl ester carboxylesterase
MKISQLSLAVELFKNQTFKKVKSVADMGTKTLRVKYDDLEYLFLQGGIHFDKSKFSFLKKSNSINDEYTEWAWNNLHKSKDDFIYADGGRFVVPYDARSWIQEIEAETLVITGGRDKLVPEETSNDVVKRLNEVKVKTFPDAGHSVPWTHEEDLLTELREFFSL